MPDNDPKNSVLYSAARLDGEMHPLVQGVDYIVESGKWVFTAAYLLRRGECCGSGCRNCPYGGEHNHSKKR